MRHSKFLFALAAFALCLTGARAADWRIAGDFVESCSCGVPCNCNFGEGPAPYSWCYAIFSIDIKEGHYNDVKLEGLKLGGAMGEKGMVWYIDDRADERQFAALRAIGDVLYAKAMRANGIKDLSKAPPGYKLLGYRKAKIEQSSGDKQASLKLGNTGGFVADYIMGIDGKSPVKVLNNWSWNMADGWKAKAKTLAYKDGFGNKFSYKARNSNIGTVDWTDKTAIYFR